jgi:hypothetical protein
MELHHATFCISVTIARASGAKCPFFLYVPHKRTAHAQSWARLALAGESGVKCPLFTGQFDDPACQTRQAN